MLPELVNEPFPRRTSVSIFRTATHHNEQPVARVGHVRERHEPRSAAAHSELRCDVTSACANATWQMRAV